VTLEGSGRTTVTTPALYRGLKAVDVDGTPMAPRSDGRLRFVADLGAPHTVQQYTPGASTSAAIKRVALAPHAIVRITNVTRVGRGLRVCARSIGGDVPRARITAGGPGVVVRVGAKTKCHRLALRRLRTVTVRGRDAFGHAVRATSAD
jgi:hypothetical protein